MCDLLLKKCLRSSRKQQIWLKSVKNIKGSKSNRLNRRTLRQHIESTQTINLFVTILVVRATEALSYCRAKFFNIGDVILIKRSSGVKFLLLDEVCKYKIEYIRLAGTEMVFGDAKRKECNFLQ